MTGPTLLVERFVEGVLNGHDAEIVETLFHPRFMDRDPLVIPGVVDGDGIAGRPGIAVQVKLLSSPGVDIRFTLEDAFDNGSDRVGYRLFGEGSLPLTPELEHETREPGRGGTISVRKLGVAGTSLAFRSTWLRRSQPLAQRFSITYSCVGVFRIEDRRFLERWGRIHVE